MNLARSCGKHSSLTASLTSVTRRDCLHHLCLTLMAPPDWLGLLQRSDTWPSMNDSPAPPCRRAEDGLQGEVRCGARRPGPCQRRQRRPVCGDARRGSQQRLRLQLIACDVMEPELSPRLWGWELLGARAAHLCMSARFLKVVRTSGLHLS